MTVTSVCVSVFVLIVNVTAIWPPPHEINLQDSETFVISEIWNSDDILSDKDEMLPVKPPTNEDKYFKIHQMVLKHNKRELKEKRKAWKNVTKINERNFDIEDPIPWEGGFVDKDGNFIQQDNHNVYYLNEMAKTLIDSKIEEKRQNEEDKKTESEHYDYGSFKAEYEAEVQKAKEEKDTFNYTDVKEDENVKTAVDTVVDFKKPINCTAEEAKGIGIGAIKCIVSDIKVSKSKNSIISLLEKILKIILIWLCVYALIAIPCWCERGWCCCCCCCKICKPRDVIEEAKRFYTQNPVGVFHDNENKEIKFQPTMYEIYTQRRLEKALFNL